MWNSYSNEKTRFQAHAGEYAGGIARVLTVCALTTGMLLAAAAYAFAAPAGSNALAGADSLPGTNWITLQRPVEGAAPGAGRWRPWLWRRIFNAEHPNARRRIFNAEHPNARRRIFNARHPNARRRIFNARHPNARRRIFNAGLPSRPQPRHRVRVMRRR